MNRFDEMDMDLDAMYNDVRVDEKCLGLFRVYSGSRVYNSFRNFGGFGLQDGRLLKLEI